MLQGIYIFKPKSGVLEIGGINFNDLYLVIRNQDGNCYTSISKKCKNKPKWNDQIIFKVSEDGKFQIEIWDYLVNDEAKIGYFVINLADINEIRSNLFFL